MRAALVGALVLASACKKPERAPPKQTVTPMSADEVKRSEDACKMYVDKACGCATKVPDAAKECTNAKALPDAVRIALDVASYPDSKPEVVVQSQSGVRKTVKECIEGTARLATLGCPP